MKSERFTAGHCFIERNRRRKGRLLFTPHCAANLPDRLPIQKQPQVGFKWPKSRQLVTPYRDWLASFEQKPQALRART